MRSAFSLLLLFGICLGSGCGKSDKPDITKHPEYSPNPDPRTWDLYGGTPLDTKGNTLGKSKKGKKTGKKKSKETNQKE
jgi:hypothetical protein